MEGMLAATLSRLLISDLELDIAPTFQTPGKQHLGASLSQPVQSDLQPQARLIPPLKSACNDPTGPIVAIHLWDSGLRTRLRAGWGAKKQE
jgi:hypothetical protein